MKDKANLLKMFTKEMKDVLYVLSDKNYICPWEIVSKKNSIIMNNADDLERMKDKSFVILIKYANKIKEIDKELI